MHSSLQYSIVHCFIYLPPNRITTIMIYYNDIILLMLEYFPDTPLTGKTDVSQTHSIVVVSVLLMNRIIF